MSGGTIADDSWLVLMLNLVCWQESNCKLLLNAIVYNLGYSPQPKLEGNRGQLKKRKLYSAQAAEKSLP